MLVDAWPELPEDKKSAIAQVSSACSGTLATEEETIDERTGDQSGRISVRTELSHRIETGRRELETTIERF
jgi:hypothetical protein